MAISYNVLNLQQTLSQNGTAVASYLWLEDGTKCGVFDNNNNGYDYMGSLIYSRSGSTRTLESATFGGGRFVNTNNTVLPYYYITDHLGSTRVITNNSGTIVEQNDYYPFGGRHANPSYAQNTANRHKFNGKELQTTGGIGFLDYGARMYDDVIGRWSVVDPMAGKYFSISQYAYCMNSPVRLIDPDGQEFVDPNGERVIITFNKNGLLNFSKNATVDIIRAANALNLTSAGRNELKEINQSDIKVKLNISPDSRITQQNQGKTSYTYGKTIQGNYDENDNYGRKINYDGTYGIKEASITIYEGTIKESIKNGSKLKHQGLTLE